MSRYPAKVYFDTLLGNVALPIISNQFFFGLAK